MCIKLEVFKKNSLTSRSLSLNYNCFSFFLFFSSIFLVGGNVKSFESDFFRPFNVMFLGISSIKVVVKNAPIIVVNHIYLSNSIILDKSLTERLLIQIITVIFIVESLESVSFLFVFVFNPSMWCFLSYISRVKVWTSLYFAAKKFYTNIQKLDIGN